MRSADCGSSCTLALAPGRRRKDVVIGCRSRARNHASRRAESDSRGDQQQVQQQPPRRHRSTVRRRVSMSSWLDCTTRQFTRFFRKLNPGAGRGVTQRGPQVGRGRAPRTPGSARCGRASKMNVVGSDSTPSSLASAGCSSMSTSTSTGGSGSPARSAIDLSDHPAHRRARPAPVGGEVENVRPGAGDAGPTPGLREQSARSRRRRRTSPVLRTVRRRAPARGPNATAATSAISRTS